MHSRQLHNLIISKHSRGAFRAYLFRSLLMPEILISNLDSAPRLVHEIFDFRVSAIKVSALASDLRAFSISKLLGSLKKVFLKFDSPTKTHICKR